MGGQYNFDKVKRTLAICAKLCSTEKCSGGSNNAHGSRASKVVDTMVKVSIETSRSDEQSNTKI